MLENNFCYTENTISDTTFLEIYYTSTATYTEESKKEKVNGNISDSEISKMALSYSEESLSEEWDNEADAHWDNYTK